MTNVVSDGLGRVQATGQKVREGVGTAVTGLRGEMGAVAHGVREEIDGIRQHAEHPTAHKRERSAWAGRLVGLAASAAGAAVAFVVSRLVAAALRRRGE
jgi:hypothetical protein